ncbi:hypothetical protein ISS22_01600 [candidate division KSB1 bacterium]|nr:hypothetical protein [candidate division KSB1 bacterium]
MKNFTRIFLFFIIFYSTITSSSIGCTTAIVSGKFTVDGRPLLFKHRDTGTLQNKLMFFNDGKYKYIGLVNSTDSLGKEIWAGCNDAGFAIMNSASYNLNTNDTTAIKDREGFVMKMALQSCVTVDDFEQLLNNLPKPLGVEANFGVIDANGGAAYFETGNFAYSKIDANDPKIAPFGYVIRSNYSFTGDTENGYGFIRYQTADDLFYQAAQTNSLSHKFILQKVSRCLKHSLTKIDFTENLPKNSDKSYYVNFRDFIPRNSSASTVVVQGVKKGESPEFATMWTILGFQLCSVTIPTWVSGGNNLPKILVADETGNAPLCDMALQLKEECIPLKRGSGKYYLNLAALMNQTGDGILQKTFPLENKILSLAESYLKHWREKGLNKKQVKEFYKIVDDMVLLEYQKRFGL